MLRHPLACQSAVRFASAAALAAVTTRPTTVPGLNAVRPFSHDEGNGW